ncbi:MAG: plasmid pRiA4b ORF-3 family protein [Ginsengibacter sp.]
MLQFKIQLKQINDPTVWRRLLVPSQFSFHKFHQVIQAAFGWHNCHLYEFSPKGIGSQPTIGEPHESYEDEVLDSKKIKLFKIFTVPKQRFVYTYDFGDDWAHAIILEKITNDASLIADCIGGKGACPPEDCGGFYGYMDLKKIVNNPKHPEHEEMKEWLGLSENGKWDANAFDLKKTSDTIRRIR